MTVSISNLNITAASNGEQEPDQIGPGDNGGNIFNAGTLFLNNDTISNGRVNGITSNGVVNGVSANGGGIFNATLRESHRCQHNHYRQPGDGREQCGSVCALGEGVASTTS